MTINVWLALFLILLYLTTLGVTIATLIGFLGRLWWRFDLFNHFRAQYALILVVCTTLFFSVGLIPEALWAGFFLLVNLLQIAPFYLRPGHAFATGKVYRTLLSNVLEPNREFHKLSQVIEREQPDFILLLEVDQRWLEELSPAMTAYPNTLSQMWENKYGLAFYSKFPFTSAEVYHFGIDHVPSLVVNFDLDGQPLTIIGTHPPPPRSPKEARCRDAQLRQVAEFAAKQPGKVILMGDLNNTSWSPVFRDLLRISRLRDSRLGFGLQASWPATNPFLRVPIDHLLVSPGIAVHNRRLGPTIGSDHFPVLMDFSIPS